MEKGIKRIRPENFFSLKSCRGGSGPEIFFLRRALPIGWAKQAHTPPSRNTEVSALILRSRACTFTVGCSHCHIQNSLQITKTSLKVPEKRESLVKKSMKNFPNPTRIRIVINTDELYNSSKFLHGAVL